jgi:hypothetical protein
MSSQQLSSRFTSLLTPSQQQKIIQVANNLKIQANWLAAVMYFESGRTFSPSVTNNIGSTGLIQFTRDKAGVNYKTIGGKRYLLSDIGKMTFEQQMDLVEKYYREAVGSKKLTSFIDTYLVTFFPAALGQPDGFVLKTAGLSAKLIAGQNPAFDTNKDEQIKKSEVVDYFRSLYNHWGFDFDNEINTGGKIPIPLVGFCVTVFFYSLWTTSTLMSYLLTN